MNTCHHCRNEMMFYKARVRQSPWLQNPYHYFMVVACGADPRHNVDILFYDLEVFT